MEKGHVLPPWDGVPGLMGNMLILSFHQLELILRGMWLLLILLGRKMLRLLPNHVLYYAGTNASQLKEQEHAAPYPGDLLYWLSLEVFGALRPIWPLSTGMCDLLFRVQANTPSFCPYCLFWTTGVCCTIEGSNIHYSLRATVVGFGPSRQILFMTPLCRFTPKLY